ncbi:transcriptional regulator, XRE family [Thermoclostridium stercorarium subsp. stercorarium DSM 8532]|uniref:Transcriptional regulator, XRE family n=3 Tax=Thermoclostridium stercorarium TaxID=1510 RepID=L7VQY0_THES1|nr:helix-turn-helix transcriptional regulator [Thermoclostridium stercorarium]AGC69079.1 transcriptional regulator, XRE family [Thermoclostridium stercorarium subsp. stercorarium DSM 8532]AGI40052.1 HTH domain-containing protein [Thermoclostridium stercorarium subsp. stercorarium DSM 8532]ANW99371.1 transcriptional regulator [Thermoclostridium stercorarium subsp. thermolacticum DSM 2910]ANX02001.1 transcriptional regulator [Thermoclostridium stercorarium subsp. leptospartum DSM 9219]UZQ85040.1
MEIKVGEIIRAKREEKNISLSDFARELDISPGYLSQIENGIKKNPNLEILLKIINKLDIDLSMLLGVENREENYMVKIPSLLKLTLAKDRYNKVLEEPEVLKKYCLLTERILDAKYMINDIDLYKMFLNDIIDQAETMVRRYMNIEVLINRKQ